MACKICPHGRRENTCSRCRPESTFERHKREARRRKKTSELTFAQYSQLVSGNCAWCGSNDPVVVDRIDSTRHYYLANCQPLCKRDNQIKWSTPESEIWNHLKKIIAHRSELAVAAALAAGYVKAGTAPQAPAVPAGTVEEPPVEPPQQLANLARVPTPPHSWEGLSEEARRYLLEGR